MNRIHKESGGLDSECLLLLPAPYMKAPDTVADIMLDVIIALLFPLAWGAYMFGTRVLLITLTSVFCCVLFEAGFQIIMKRRVTVGDLSAVVTGLLISLSASVAVPLWLVAAGSFFAIVIVKQLFGGIGKNIANPALAAHVFMYAWPEEMGVFVENGKKLSFLASTADVVSAATPLETLKTGYFPDESFFDMVLGNRGGAIGEVSVLIIIAAAVFLLIRKIITWHAPVSFILTSAVLFYLLPQVEGQAADFMLYELLSGGLLFSAIFMANDYTTTPVTKKGRFLFGIGCGALTVLIRYYGIFPEGASFAILTMNFLVWPIDQITAPRRYGRKAGFVK